MSGPCTDCGGPDYQTLLARIAELDADLAEESRQADEAVGSCRVRIAELEAELAEIKARLNDLWRPLAGDDKASWTATWAERMTP